MAKKFSDAFLNCANYETLKIHGKSDCRNCKKSTDKKEFKPGKWCPNYKGK